MYIVYGKPGCGFCTQAVNLLTAKGYTEGTSFQYVDLTQDANALTKLKELGFRSVPQIYEDERHVGGFTELSKELA